MLWKSSATKKVCTYEIKFVFAFKANVNFPFFFFFKQSRLKIALHIMLFQHVYIWYWNQTKNNSIPIIPANYHRTKRPLKKNKGRSPHVGWVLQWRGFEIRPDALCCVLSPISHCIIKGKVPSKIIIKKKNVFFLRVSCKRKCFIAEYTFIKIIDVRRGNLGSSPGRECIPCTEAQSLSQRAAGSVPTFGPLLHFIPSFLTYSVLSIKTKSQKIILK